MSDVTASLADHVYFTILATEDKSVRAYLQKRADRPNPPFAAKHRDPRNRPEGYAAYREGFIYFDPDEVLVEKGDALLPKKRASLGALLEEDPEILTELEKARQRTLMFQNCHLDSELALSAFLLKKD